MPWQQTTIGREEPYRAVWAEPMTKLCTRYGISDVGLRKVCVKLGVPVPPAGHWSRVRACKQTPRPPLPATHDSDQHVLARWFDPEVGTQRVSPATEEDGHRARLSGLVVSVPTDRARWHRSVLRTEPALATAKTCDERGRLLPPGVGAHEVRVSSEMRSRALELCEVLLCAFDAAGLKVEEPTCSTERPRAFADPYWVVWRIVEVAAAANPAQVGPPPGARRTSSRTAQRPQLRVDFMRENESAVALSVRDTAGSPLERRAGQVVVELLLANSVARAKADDAEERRRAAQDALRARVFSYELRRHELGELESTEELADRHRRAAALRTYAAAVERTSSERRRLTDEERVQRVAWIRRAADWLDPTTAAPWPEVDDAPGTPF